MNNALRGSLSTTWTTTKFKYMAVMKKGHLPKYTMVEPESETDIPYLSMDYLRGQTKTPSYVSPQPDLVLAEDSDILLLWDGANAGEFLRAKTGVVSSTSARVEPCGVHHDYLFWACKALEATIRSETVGMGIPHVDSDFLANISLLVPPLPEQQTIADYLDRETAKIDAMIAAKENLLELLAEKRRALITRAVTRGLNPDASLRDSGIPWLGKIPVNWVTTRLKFVAEVRGGLTIGKNYGRSELSEYFYLRVANVQDGVLDLSDISTVSVPDNEAISCLLKYGDVLMNEGGDSDKLGRGCVWRDEISPCLHQNHVFAVRPIKIKSEWLNAWTSSEVAKSYFESRSKQSTNLASISATNIKELPVLLPSKTEQRSIVAYINQETAKLDALKQAAEQTIGLLKERRSALIAAAVTGRLEIPQ